MRKTLTLLVTLLLVLAVVLMAAGCGSSASEGSGNYDAPVKGETLDTGVAPAAVDATPAEPEGQYVEVAEPSGTEEQDEEVGDLSSSQADTGDVEAATKAGAARSLVQTTKKRTDKTVSKLPYKRTTFNFVVRGDNRDSGTIFPELLKKLNKDNSIFVMDAGDLVHTGSSSNYDKVLRQLTVFKRPFITAIGNHELYSGGKEIYYRVFGHYYYSFHIGKSYFIVLDNSNTRTLGTKQWNWLKGRLDNSKRYKNVFVIMHVPIYDPLKKGSGLGHGMQDAAYAKKLNKLFDAYHITMLFTSHVHGYAKGRWGKTPFILTGGAGAPLAGPPNNTNYFYNYVKVRVTPGGVSYQVVKHH